MVFGKDFSRRFRSTLQCMALAGLAVTVAPLTAALAPAGSAGDSPALSAPALGQSFTVTSMDGSPLEGVVLSLQPRPEAMLPESVSQTTISVSSKNGEIQRPPAEVMGHYFLLEKDGFETLALNAARPLPGTVTLRPGRSLSGQVMAADGQPIAGAVVGPVTMAKEDEDDHATAKLLPRRAVRSGADGSFTLSGIPLQGINLQISALGHTPRLVLVQPGEKSMKVALETDGGTITGTVLGSKDRAPQGGINVEAVGDGFLLYAQTDPNGAFALNNLPTGSWRLRAAGGGPLSGTQSQQVVLQLDEPTQRLEAQLVLNQGILLAGRAIDAITSQGLAGINITLAGYAGRGAKAVLTDPDGSFAFRNLDSMQDVLIRFDPVKFVYLLPNGAYRDYFDISQVSDTNFDVTTLTIPLHRRLEVRGTVKDAAGKTVPDVEIHMQALDVVAGAKTKSGLNLLDFMTQSNGTGNFLAGVYPPGRYKVWAQQEALVSQVETIDVFSTAPARAVDLKLDQAATLGGTVTDASDRIVTGAVVIAWPSNAPEPEEDPIPGRDSYRFAKSGPDGHFELTGLRGEPLVLRASHPDFLQPVKASFDPAAATPGTSATVALKFPAGGEFSVLVSDDQGQPLSQAEVAFDYKVELNGHRASVMTDRFGRAFASSIPAKVLDKVVISHPLFASFESPTPVPLPQKDVKISLTRRGSLDATVKGDPLVPGVTPEVFLLSAPVGAGGSAAKPPESGFSQTGRTGVVAGHALFRSLPDGWYKVAFAESGAYAESEVVRMEAGGGDKAVTLTIPKGNHLVGLVTDKATGKPIPGTNVTLHPALQSDIIAERATQNTTTNGEGRFELYNVGSGRLHVKAIAADYPEYDQTITFSAGDELKIEMTNQPATLSGRVTAGGTGVEGALLVLTRGGTEHTPVATAITDESGAYTMDGFTEGTYSLSVEAPIGEGENISRKTVPAEIKEADAKQDVEFAALVKVSGKVRLNGKTPSRPGTDQVVLLFRGAVAGMESKMAPLREDGQYQVQLEPGEYIVSLEDQEGRPVTVNGGGSQQIDLNF